MNSFRTLIQRRRTSGLPAFPVGRTFPRFPLLTEMTFGLQGIFVIVGPTGVGKSTLATHLAADVVAEDFPGVYFESENTFLTDDGVESFAFLRSAHSYGDDPRLDHLAHTTDFEQAKDWLRTRTPRGFLVVDTIQGSIEAKDHDGHLDAGVLHALERRAKELITLANEGYAILVVSQTNDRNSKQPPTLGALKGASALEQMAWTVVGYGTARKTAADTRALVLRKLRRPTAKEWPIDSRLLIKTDGQDGLSEAGTGAAPRDEPKPAASPAERVARARAEHPGASLRELARLSKVSKSHVANLLKVSTQVSTVDSSGQSSGQHESPAATRT